MVLNKGVVRQLGTPKDVYDDPADNLRGHIPGLAAYESDRK